MGLRAIALVLLFPGAQVMAAPHLAHASLQREYLTVDGRPYGSDYVHHQQPIAQELTYEKLKELILSRQLRGIPDVIAALPNYMIDDNYIVMYRSRSLQDASPGQPRVLVFTPAARLILSFNGGDAGFSGHDSIELTQFRDDGARFEFREITFHQGSDPRFSGPDPKKCAACHQGPQRRGVDLRPNWEPYNVWPGAIGSHGGSFRLFGKIKRDHRIRQQDEQFLDEQAREPEIVREFLRLSPNHFRYRHLGRLNEFATSDFTDLLAVLNFKRVVRLMKENTEHFEQSKELIAMLGDCAGSVPGDIMDFYKERAPKNRYFDYA